MDEAEGSRIVTQAPIKVELERDILEILSGDARRVAEIVFDDSEIQALQDYANVVSVKRLGMNDHGPVHVRICALNSLTMLALLESEGIRASLHRESGLDSDDSRMAVFLGAVLHDLGMSIGRDDHEEYSLLLAKPIIDRILAEIEPDSIRRRTAIASTALECIAGHMATRKISSVEAGLVLVGDGCDMEHGRSRAPARLSLAPQVGDIHQYSAAAVEDVEISKGGSKPIRIGITLRENAGFFQVENVLYPKINISPVKGYIELHAGLKGREPLQYL